MSWRVSEARIGFRAEPAVTDDARGALMIKGMPEAVFTIVTILVLLAIFLAGIGTAVP
jgi:hypothetical protein